MSLEFKTRPLRYWRDTLPNSALRGIGKGMRCFIVCSGPSVKNQDLIPLAHEWTFFVSTGFLHPHYSLINPLYHCVPPMEHNDRYTAWIQRLFDETGDTTLFFSALDRGFIEASIPFHSRKIHYLNMCLPVFPSRRKIWDISRPIMGIQSVPVMALMVAMHLGFSQVFFLGLELDGMWSGEFRHFYDEEILRDEDATDEKCRVTTPLIEQFRTNYDLWSQFESLRLIAEANGIEVFNATDGGKLDIFPRVRLEDAL
jgi:hypothetical protein